MKTNAFLKVFIFLAIAGFVFLMNNCKQPEEKQAPPESVSDLMDPNADIEHGSYLVTIGGCDDCHSPKIMTEHGPVIDSSKRLSGHPANAVLPAIDKSEIAPGKWILASQDLTAWVGPFGVSFPANLTPDTATGSGAWTPELFIKILRSGKHMGGESARPILPPMPWESISKMTDGDLRAVFAFLQSLPPVSNKVPDPLPPIQ